MKWLSDDVLDHLCRVVDWPDLTGTRYDLVEQIGQGGMATLYRATDRVLDRPVALKVLADPLPNPQARQRLVDEARIIARLEHPGIVPVHDAGTLPDGRLYYTMKLVRGQRLDAHLSAASPLSERLRTFEQLCQAVAFAHAQGVLHRDLKPQNVMVGPFGEVLVLDWGLAKVVGASEAASSAGKGPLAPATQTQAGSVLGTPGYMAPEQARGDVEQIDERTDVYGLGAILYYLLTRQAPGTSPTLPRRHNPSLPRPLEAICRKALAPEPSGRYPTAQALAADVARYLAGLRVEAYPESLAGTLLRLASNYRAAVVLILAYMLMRVLLLFWAGT